MEPIPKAIGKAADIIEKQNIIIREQTEIIDDLVLLLSEHITVKAFEELPVAKKMNETAAMRSIL